MPDATTATQPTAAAPPPLPSTSIDDLLSPEKYQKIVGQEQKLIERKIGAEGAVTAEYERREKAERERMERLTKAEGVSPDDLKPWDPNTMAPPPTSLWDKFGSPGFVISMLASAFTAMPMNSALQAGGAAMDAINRGDQEGYKRAFDTWKINTDLVIKRQEMEHKAFEDIAKLRETDMTEWRAKMEGILRQFGDERKLILLQNGMDDELIQSESTLAKSTQTMAEASNFIKENEIRRQLFNTVLAGSKDPKKIIEASMFADMVMTGPRSPQQLALYDVVTKPGFIDLPTPEQEKQIQTAVSGLNIDLAAPTQKDEEGKPLPYSESFGVKGAFNWLSRKVQDFATGSMSEGTAERTRATQEWNNLRFHTLNALSADVASEQRLKMIQERVKSLFPDIEHLWTGPTEAISNIMALRNDILNEMHKNIQIATNPSFDKKDQEKARLRLIAQQGVVREMDKVLMEIQSRDKPESKPDQAGPWDRYK